MLYLFEKGWGVLKMLAGIEVSKKKLKYHLKFTRRAKPKGKKTNIYNVIKIMDDSPEEHLGLVKWNGGFRKYWFLPDNDTGWSGDCMDLVSAFLKKVNKRHWNKIRKRRLAQKICSDMFP